MAITLAANSAFSSPYTEATSFSVAFDAGSADRRVLVVKLVMHDDGATPTFGTPTYNGSNLTLQEAAEHLYAGNGRVERTEIWTHTSPASGSNTLAGTMSETTAQIEVYAEVWSDASSTLGNSNSGGGNVDTYSLAITTSASTSRITGAVGGVASRDWTMTTGTEIATVDDTVTQHWSISGYEAGSGGADTWDVSNTGGAVRSSAAALEVLEDTGGGGGGTILSFMMQMH